MTKTLTQLQYESNMLFTQIKHTQKCIKFHKSKKCQELPQWGCSCKGVREWSDAFYKVLKRKGMIK